MDAVVAQHKAWVAEGRPGAISHEDMVAELLERPAGIERTFTAIRAVLPAPYAAMFDDQLQVILRAPVMDLAALDDFLSGWHHAAVREAGGMQAQAVGDNSEDLEAGS